MVLHVCPRNLHFKFCKNQCALRVVFTLKRTIAYLFGPLWGHFWAPQNYPIWLFLLLEHYRHSDIYHIKFHDSTHSGSGWATPKMSKNGRFLQFFGAVHILNRRRALGVAPLTLPLSELPTHQMLWKSVRVKGLFWN